MTVTNSRVEVVGASVGACLECWTNGVLAARKSFNAEPEQAAELPVHQSVAAMFK